VPLDAGGRWFRYHHLFADLLRTLLERYLPGASGALHQRAAYAHVRLLFSRELGNDSLFSSL
jgi:ATP/maltotriose-dependent transcriptional regulator MalT